MKGGLFWGCLGWEGGWGLKVPASLLTIERQYKLKKKFLHFLTVYIKTGKINECQGNGITLDRTKMQIKSVRALLAPSPPLIGLREFL